ncbi:unnamed protein product [Leptosia nina]|uniref:Receptor expression-enhancing protein 1 n=1 Tax=Leptosia nina TaxID=320188 RepID=A0AAV1K4N8_9NEOP
MISSIISRLVILVFGTLYPAYASYKAVRTKNLKEYVKWMMYWIVFALFTCTETFTDVFLSWFPFYYEVKIVLVLWLLSPATKGSSILYRKFVHPALCRREQEIDEYIAKAKDQGYHTVLNLGTKGVNYATTVIMQTAIKNLNLPNVDENRAITNRDEIDGYQAYEDFEYQRAGDNLPGIVEIVELHDQSNEDGTGDGIANDPDYDPEFSAARSRDATLREHELIACFGCLLHDACNTIHGGGGLVQQLRKSYSLSDLTECEPREEHAADEVDDVLSEPRLLRRAVKSAYVTRRSASESNSRQPLYFPEVDVDVRGPRPRLDEPDFSHIKSTEDISSGYSSADNSASLTRTGSVGASARSRARTTRTTVTTIKRPQAAEDKEVIIEELQEDDFDNTMPPLVSLSSPLYLSHTVPPFIYQYAGDKVKIIQVLGHYPLNEEEDTSSKYQRDQKKDDSNGIDTINLNTDSKYTILQEIDNNCTEELDNSNNCAALKVNTEFNTECSELAPDNQSDVTNIFVDAESICTSVKDSSSDDSYDEASFGTPEPTPKSVKKLLKGKYGKNKAPLPPKNEDEMGHIIAENVDKLPNGIFEQNIEIMENIEPKIPNDIPDNLEVNSKQRSKSKSPSRSTVGNLGLGKLLQFPNKLAFWNKGDEKSKSDLAISPDNNSRSTSALNEELQSCSDVTKASKDDSRLNLKVEENQKTLDCSGAEENIIHNIKEKSDELQKVIEAKLENHPEYKFIPLNDDNNGTSKSTDV